MTVGPWAENPVLTSSSIVIPATVPSKGRGSMSTKEHLMGNDMFRKRLTEDAPAAGSAR